MFSRVRLCLGAAVAAAVLAGASAASAATASSLSVQQFDRTQLSEARKAMSDHVGGITVKGLETFSGYKAWDGSSGTTNPRIASLGAGNATLGDASS